MKHSSHMQAFAVRRRQRGLSLVELMVAMTIGAVLIFGATQVFLNSRNSYGVNESVARLQESARYAMSVIEPDVRMANYWGLSATAPIPAAQPVTAGACGATFVVDFPNNLVGDNNTYQLSADSTAACDALTDINTGAAWATNAVATADTLVVRRASAAVSAATPGIMQVCSTRANSQILGGTPCPGGTVGQINNLFINAYYIDRNSAQLAGLPSLRRKTLSSAVGGVPRMLDQEIMPGVEDMQVQFGVAQQAAVAAGGGATRYVNPNAVPVGYVVVAVRIWLLVRADIGESGFTDNRVYTYGDRVGAGVTGDLNSVAAAGVPYQPSLNPDAALLGARHARRLLISRTIFVRNSVDN